MSHYHGRIKHPLFPLAVISYKFGYGARFHISLDGAHFCTAMGKDGLMEYF